MLERPRTPIVPTSSAVPSRRSVSRVAPFCMSFAVAALASASMASAQRIENGKAVFAALDKVTARISKLEVSLGETTQFGALRVTPRACYSRPPTEPPKTSTFVEVEETQVDGKVQRIFSGWMFAESPGLNAVEHPVYDVWLTECTSPLRAAAPKAAPVGKAGAPGETGAPAQALPPEPAPEEFRRRPRR